MGRKSLIWYSSIFIIIFYVIQYDLDLLFSDLVDQNPHGAGLTIQTVVDQPSCTTAITSPSSFILTVSRVIGMDGVSLVL